MTNEMAASFAETKDHLNEMSLAWQGLSQRIYSVVNPAVDAAVKELTNLIEHTNGNTIRAGVTALTDDAIGLAESVMEWAIKVEGAIDGIIAKFQSAAAAWANASSAGSNFLSAIKGDPEAVKAFNSAFDGLFGSSNSAAGGLDAASAAALRVEMQLDAVRKQAEAAKNSMHGLLTPSGTSQDQPTETSNATKPQAGTMQLGGGSNQAAKDAEAEASQEIAIYTKTLSAKEGLLNDELKLHQISMSQWLAQTKDALQDELQDTLATYEQELTAAGLTSAQKDAIRAKEAEAATEYAKKVQDAETKAAEETTQKWQSAMSTINGAFNSQINGLLTGTTNWHTAFTNVLKDLTESLLKFFVDWGLQQAETVAKNILSENVWLAAHVTGAATAASADAAASSTSLAATLAQKTAIVTADAGQAAAGVAAFLAPLIGPAAVPAGASAGAEVMGIGAMDIGAYDIPENQLALVHKNELVMPAAQAGAFRNMLESGGSGGGQPNVSTALHMTVQAMDGASVKRVFHDNSDHLLSAVRKEMTRGGYAALRRMKFS